ncbi:EAL domain-containing protein [Undibacterium arcticum]
MRHQVRSSSFCLEITESSIMDDPVRAQQTLERLHAMGVELSIDDFGTGYSSLAYLKRLPVDELKIDKSFVQNMARDADDRKIVRSTIDLGHNMGLRVVAEGIEKRRGLASAGRDGLRTGARLLHEPADAVGSISRLAPALAGTNASRRSLRR